MVADKRDFTEEKYQRKLKAGHGRGEGADYLPWIRRTDLRSRGTRHHASCGRTGRDAHVMSTTEHKTFLFYDSRPWVLNVYEQYRLDRDETLEIARDLGIEHPMDRNTRVMTVISSDLVIEGVARDGQQVRYVRSCKLSTAVDKYNNIEHAEIERRYWKRRGFDWKFVLDSGVTSEMYANLELMRPNRFLHTETQPYDGCFDETCELVRAAVLNAGRSQPLVEFAKSVAPHINGRYQAADVLLYLIYRGQLVADMASSSFLEQDVTTVAKNSQELTQPNRRFA